MDDFKYQNAISQFAFRFSVFVLIVKNCFGTDYQVFNNKAYFYILKLNLNAYF